MTTRTTNNPLLPLLLLLFSLVSSCSAQQSWFSLLDPLPFVVNSSLAFSSVSVQVFNPLCHLQLASRCNTHPVQYYNFSVVDERRFIYKSNITAPCLEASSQPAWNLQVFCAGIPNQSQTVRWLNSAPQCRFIHWSVIEQTCKKVTLQVTTPFDAWFISPEHPDAPYVVTQNSVFVSSVQRAFNTSVVWTIMPMLRDCQPQSLVVEFDPVLVTKCQPKPAIDFSLGLSLSVDSLSEHGVLVLSWFLIVLGYTSGLLFGFWQRSVYHHQFVVTYVWNLCAMPVLLTTGFSAFVLTQLLASLVSLSLFTVYYVLLFAKHGKSFISLPTHFNFTNLSCFLCVLSCNLFLVLVALISPSSSS